ncbi:MAG TPA: ABC transporter ATP-binding protein [Casimicrobiaceae bacterium]|nr:ABC transporter ATP-binding protein [Casimicrobiaceae bacterium]
MSDVIVRARGLAFAYGPHTVLAGLELDLARGEIFGVIGADGAGKSTLLRLLIGQLAPKAGELTVLNLPARSTKLRSRIAYMPQSFGQYLDLTVGENLRFFAELHGLARDEAKCVIDDLVARTGLVPFTGRRAGNLSGGMMQKLALACAMVSRPEVIFLDEPTTGVDPVSRRAFWRLLEQVRADGVSIVYATSNLDEAERCDRVGLLSGGRFARSGAPLDLIRGVSAPLLALTGPNARAQRARVRAMDGVDLVFPIGESLKVWLRKADDRPRFEGSLAMTVPMLVVQTLRPSLHDIAMRDLAHARAPREDVRAALDAEPGVRQ